MPHLAFDHEHSLLSTSKHSHSPPRDQLNFGGSSSEPVSLLAFMPCTNGGNITLTANDKVSGNTTCINSVGVVGYGYVGRSIAHSFGEIADVAFHDPAVVGSHDLTALVDRSDALFVCVPTPMGANGAADLTVVFELMGQLARMAGDTPIILKSTVPPGTSAGLVRKWPRLALSFNPEFLREKHSIEDSMSPSRVVLGWTSSMNVKGRAGILDLYARAFPRAPVIEMDATEAELLKYASNALFGVKVSFANEMAELARRLGVPWEPIRQALVLDPRVGHGHLSVPGPDGEQGFGGSCLPKDIAGLLSLASTVGVELPVVAAATLANSLRRVG